MSGMNPNTLRGTTTAVYIACIASEAYDAWTSDYGRITGYEMVGSSPAMFANKVSYFFDFKGLYCEMNMTTATTTTTTTITTTTTLLLIL